LSCDVVDIYEKFNMAAGKLNMAVTKPAAILNFS